jgi:hypothetical protein
MILELQIFKLFLLTGKISIPQTFNVEIHVVTHLSSLPINSPLFDEASYFQNGIYPDFKREGARTLYNCKFLLLLIPTKVKFFIEFQIQEIIMKP